jgi:hypothetical protein
MLKRNGKVATSDDQLSLFDFARSRETEDYLTLYGLMAERDCREFRPRLVRDLEAKGVLRRSTSPAAQR